MTDTSTPESAPTPMPPDDLDALEARAWAELAAGTRSHRAAFHAGTVATQDADGPSARVVILRAVDADARRLVFHTDRRSPKVVALAADPRIGWSFYDAAGRLQLRLHGHARLHFDDAFADARWAASRPASRRAYLTTAAPGSRLPQPGDGLPPEVPPEDGHGRATADDGPWVAPARAAFAVVETLIERLDVLVLHHGGHRRARYGYAADGSRHTAAWVVP